MIGEEQFWAIIADSRARAKQNPPSKDRGFLDLQIEELRQLLWQLPVDDIVMYQRHFASYMRLAYRWDIWGAAYWLGGGCSDDGFLDFRSCLISLGKELFFQILNDPDTLAEIVDRPDVPYMQTEGFQYVATRVYREKTGQDSMPELKDAQPWLDEPAGDLFDFEDEEVMRRRYPRLVAKFPEMGD